MTNEAQTAHRQDASVQLRSKIPSVDAFGASDTGRKRQVNEDQFLLAELNNSMLVHQTSLSQADHHRLVGRPHGQLLIVADGMGGHGGGDLASSVAVDAVVSYVLNVMPWFFRLDDSREDDLIDEMKAALMRCQTSVKQAAEGGSADARMGTTLTMAYVLWPRLYVVHVGDSRCYLARGARLEQVTRDHTLAQQMVDHDVLPEGKANDVRWSSVLWNAIGGGKDELQPEVYRANLEEGDTILLCTDGLTGHLDDPTILSELQAHGSSEDTAQSLVAKANRAGGKDNVTVVVARYT